MYIPGLSSLYLNKNYISQIECESQYWVIETELGKNKYEERWKSRHVTTLHYRYIACALHYRCFYVKIWENYTINLTGNNLQCTSIYYLLIFKYYEMNML